MAQLEIHKGKCGGLGEVLGAGLTQDDLVFNCNICSAQFADYKRAQEHLGGHKELTRGGGQVFFFCLLGFVIHFCFCRFFLCRW